MKKKCKQSCLCGFFLPGSCPQMTLWAAMAPVLKTSLGKSLFLQSKRDSSVHMVRYDKQRAREVEPHFYNVVFLYSILIGFSLFSIRNEYGSQKRWPISYITVCVSVCLPVFCFVFPQTKSALMASNVSSTIQSGQTSPTCPWLMNWERKPRFLLEKKRVIPDYHPDIFNLTLGWVALPSPILWTVTQST